MFDPFTILYSCHPLDKHAPPVDVVTLYFNLPQFNGSELISKLDP